MDTQEKIKLMAEIKQNVIDYLQDELKINSDALKSYEEVNPVRDADPEIKIMREREAMKLRDRIYELNRHIAVITRM